MFFLNISFIVLLLIDFSYFINGEGYTKSKCEEITGTYCKGLRYHLTEFPNSMGQITQDEANRQMHSYEPLIKVNCSSSLKLFLCSLFFPICTKLATHLPPCRSLCLLNKMKCQPIMISFGYDWPEQMACDQYPENNLCFRINTSNSDQGRSHQLLTKADTSFKCPIALRVPAHYAYSITLDKSGKETPNCGLPCNQHFFSSPSSRVFSRNWIGLWSSLCVLSTLSTILTFLIDTRRFHYPERAIIYLSACYLIVAGVHLAGYTLNQNVSCSGPFSSTKPEIIQQNKMPQLVSQGTKSSQGCVIVFILLYFSSTASSVWWVILGVTWYLAARRNWAHESLAQKSPYFHLVAWTLPALQTTAALIYGAVEGDPLSGVCFTGVFNSTSLLVFLIIPLSIYLIVGLLFLLIGFLSMPRIRTIIKATPPVNGANTSLIAATPNHHHLNGKPPFLSTTDKLDKFIMRIGLFSVLYIVPASVVLGCYIYEWHQRPSWSLAQITDLCRSSRSSKRASEIKIMQALINPKAQYGEWGDINGVCSSHEQRLVSLGGAGALPRPQFEVFMIKYLMQLMLGITSGVWIWSSKTMMAWRRFCCPNLRSTTEGNYSVCCCCPVPQNKFPIAKNQKLEHSSYPGIEDQNSRGSPESMRRWAASGSSSAYPSAPSSTARHFPDYQSPPGPPPSTTSAMNQVPLGYHPQYHQMQPLLPSPASSAWNQSSNSSNQQTQQQQMSNIV